MSDYGFVYIWYDSYKKMFYIGSHWGTEDDGYVCSSNWMKNAYKQRPQDFKRKILIKIRSSRKNLLEEEQYWLDMIKENELNSYQGENKNVRYYNLYKRAQQTWLNGSKKIGERISMAKKGRVFSEEHKAALRDAKAKRDNSHTEEWKAENSRRMKEIWASESGEERKVNLSKLAQSEEHRKKLSIAHKESEKAKAQLKQLAETNKIASSKFYQITFSDGHIEMVHGLKAYAAANNIPYVTLFKAAQQGTKIKKYKIENVCEACE